MEGAGSLASGLRAADWPAGPFTPLPATEGQASLGRGWDARGGGPAICCHERLQRPMNIKAKADAWEDAQPRP